MPIQRYKHTLTLDHNDITNLIELDITPNADKILAVILHVPALTGATTATLTLREPDTDMGTPVMWTPGALAGKAAGDYLSYVDTETSDPDPGAFVPISGYGITIRISCSDTQAADRIFTVVLYIERA